MIEKIKRLRLRDRPQPDESFTGFFIRLTELNDYDTPSWIFEAAGLNHRLIHMGCSFAFDKSVDLSLLAQLTGVEAHELMAMTYPSKNKSDSVFMCSMFGMAVPKYVIRLRRCRICPLCLVESLYCRRIWDLAAATVCPLHKCQLVDECPKCKQRITWVRNKVAVCNCKYDWRSCVPEQVENSELEVTKQIYKLCGLPIDGSTADKELNGNPLLSLSLEHFLSALFFVASQYAGITDTKGKFLAPSRSNSEIHSLITRAFKVFENWPDNYYSFLDWRRLNRNETRHVGGLRKDFGEYKSALYKQLSSVSLDFLRDSFEEYLRTRWDGGYVTNIKRLGKLPYPKKYLSRDEARIKLQADFKDIDAFIEKGKLKGVVRQQGKSRLILIDAASVEELKRKFEDRIGLNETAQLLGISLQRVHDLVAHGCLQPLRGPTVDNYKKWKFSYRQVIDLLGSIRNMIMETADGTTDNALTFARVLNVFALCKGFGVGRFVQLILNREIAPCGEVQETGLKAFLFSEQLVHEYVRNQQQGTNNECFCITEAGKILGLERNVAYFLSRKGFIPTQKSSNNGWSVLTVTKESMELFTSTYVILKAETKQLRTTTHRLIRLLMQNGITPVSGPIIDGGHLYLFKRCDLESVDLATLVARVKEDIASNVQKNTIARQHQNL